MGTSLDIGRLADLVMTVWLLMLGGFDAVSVTVLLRRLMLQFRMGIHPFQKIVGFESAKHTVQFTGCQVGIILQHGIDELIHTMQAFLFGLELEQFFQFQHFTTFEDGLVLVVNDGIAVGLILGTVENEINAKLLLHQGAQLFFVGSHIAVLQQNGSELFPSLFIRL